MFIWGKVIFFGIPTGFRNYQYEDSPIYFSRKQNKLFVLELADNEAYFNIALGQENMIDLEKFGGYTNGDINFFYDGLKKKDITVDGYYKIIEKNIAKYEAVLSSILNIDNVVGLVLFHSDIVEQSISNYKKIELTDKPFSEVFLMEMKKNGMQSPNYG